MYRVANCLSVKPAYSSNQAHGKQNTKKHEDKFVKFSLERTSFGRNIHGIHHNLQLNPNIH